MFSILFGLACLAGLFHLNRHHFAGRHGCSSRYADDHRASFRPGQRFLRHKVDHVVRAVREALPHLEPELAAEARAGARRYPPVAGAAAGARPPPP